MVILDSQNADSTFWFCSSLVANDARFSQRLENQALGLAHVHRVLALTVPFQGMTPHRRLRVKVLDAIRRFQSIDPFHDLPRNGLSVSFL
jgi:hypothetical protein